MFQWSGTALAKITNANLFRYFNPIALRTVKTPQSFGRSECNRVKMHKDTSICSPIIKGNIICQFLFVFLGDMLLPSLIYTLKKELTSKGANSFFIKLTATEMMLRQIKMYQQEHRMWVPMLGCSCKQKILS